MQLTISRHACMCAVFTTPMQVLKTRWQQIGIDTRCINHRNKKFATERTVQIRPAITKSKLMNVTSPKITYSCFIVKVFSGDICDQDKQYMEYQFYIMVVCLLHISIHDHFPCLYSMISNNYMKMCMIVSFKIRIM